jgi:hypothetical protein
MPIYSTKEAIERFCVTTSKHAEATETGEYKVANAAYSQLIEALKWLNNNQEVQILHPLLTSPNVGTRLWTASYLLLSGDSLAETVLVEIVSLNSIHGFNAATTLREWRAGGLKPFV